MNDEATPDAGSSEGPGIGLPRPKGGRLLGDPPRHRDRPARVIGEAPSRIAPSPGRLLGERTRFSERPRRLFGDTPAHEAAPDRLFGATPEHVGAPRRLLPERDVIQRVDIPTPDEMRRELGGTDTERPDRQTATEHLPPPADATTGVASSMTGRADEALRGAPSREVETAFERAWGALREGGVPDGVASAAAGAGAVAAQEGAGLDDALDITIDHVRTAARQAGWPDEAVDVVADRVRAAAGGSRAVVGIQDMRGTGPTPRPGAAPRPGPAPRPGADRPRGGGPPPVRSTRSRPGVGRLIVLIIVGLFVATRVLGSGSGDRAPAPPAAPGPVEVTTDGQPGADLAVESVSCSDRLGDAAGGWPTRVAMGDFPSMTAAGAGVVTVATYTGEFVVLDAGTGAGALCVAALDDEAVVLEPPRRVGDGMVWVTSDSEGQGRLHGADLATGELWAYELGSGEWANISEDLVVVSSPLRSLDPRDGSERWRQDLHGSASVAADLIMVRGEGDEVIGLDGNGTERWRAERGVGFGDLTIADEAIIRTDAYLVEVRELSDGSLRWSEEMAERGMEVWGVLDGVVVCHRYGAEVVGVDLATGAVRWERPIEADGHARRLAVGSGVVVLEESGSTVVLDGVDGSTRWEADSWMGVLDGDTWLAIGDHGNQLVRLDLRDGEPMGATATDARVDMLLGDTEVGLFGLSYGDEGVVTVWPLTVP